MVDPENRGVVALGSNLAYSLQQKLDLSEKVPKYLEDFLKPEFKGKKFILDIRPTVFGRFDRRFRASSGWSITLKKLAAQDPVWARGFPVAMKRIAAGEYALHQLTNYNSCMRAPRKMPLVR